MHAHIHISAGSTSIAIIITSLQNYYITQRYTSPHLFIGLIII